MSLASFRLKGLLGALALLVIGAALGVTIDHAALLHSGQADHRGMVESLQAELDLDDDQLHAIHAILQHHRERVEHAWTSVRPEVQAAVDSIEKQVAEVLRPEQRERFHAWFADHHPREGDGD